MALETMVRLMINNSDLEVRVEILEGEVADLTAGLSLANEDISNLQDSEVIQDERFLNIEDEITNLDTDVESKSYRKAKSREFRTYFHHRCLIWLHCALFAHCN